MNNTQFVFGLLLSVAVSVALAAALAVSLSRPAKHIEPQKIDEQAPKGDRDFVRTIPIVKQPPPIMAQAAPKKEEPVAEEPLPRGDLCSRYGGRRVDYGRRWRCAYDHKRRRSQ
jgi:hypothetical protein